MMNKYQLKKDADFHNKQEVGKIWLEIRHNLKYKQLLNCMKEFDIMSLKEKQINQVRKVFLDIPLHSVLGYIQKDQHVVGYNLVIWMQNIILYRDITLQLGKLGVNELEDKLEQCLKIKVSLEKIFSLPSYVQRYAQKKYDH
ncbi:UNKNOWN [Stylonychia lemnae]|uniref:Uncharacterized protein n=1 Tax=Stylonychia lemnae TaxID=5949 RepID=A0A078AM42_STYLE|nr:UNKNOWN [Stylonychia lemnae]|eukprot:CDW81893.1 UNKNOWN [Stylonychia lemnae]